MRLPKRSTDFVSAFEIPAIAPIKLARKLDRDFKSGTEAVREFQKKSDESARKFSGNIGQMAGVTSQGLHAIEGDFNNSLKALNVDQVSFNLRAASRPVGKGGKAPFATGGYITGGAPVGDSIPAMLERGEGVLNRNATAALGGRGFVDWANKRFSRFQTGGMAGLNPAISSIVNWASQKYGAVVTSGYRPGDSDSWHGSGAAADLVSGDMGAMARGLFSNFRSKLEELFYDPLGFYIPTRGVVSQGAIGGHTDHVHAAALGAAVAAVGGAAARIARQMVQGPGGGLRDVAQPVLDQVRRAANRKLGATGFFGAEPTAGGMSKTAIMALWRQINPSVGDPNLMAAIAMAESSGIPTAHGPPDGRGLYQIEWPIWGATLGQVRESLQRRRQHPDGAGCV